MNEKLSAQPTGENPEPLASLEQKEYKIVTPEQKKAIEQIEEIDQKIDKVKIIINSITHRTDSGERWERLTTQHQQEKYIKEDEDELLNAYLSGEETGVVEEQLLKRRTEANYNADFYGEQKDQMLQVSESSDGSYYDGPNKIIGQDSEAFPDDIKALIRTLEELGLSEEEFIASMREARPAHADETSRAESALSAFKQKLTLERNICRLALPNEAIKMTGEALKETGRDTYDYVTPVNEIVRGHTDRSFQIGALYEKVAPKSWELATYPPEVQERYYEFLAKKSLTAVGKNTTQFNAAEIERGLAKDMAEIYALSSEQSRWVDDVEFDVKTQEAVLEFLKDEEGYLVECLKNGTELTLRSPEHPIKHGIRFDPNRKEFAAEIEWPVLDFKVNSQEDELRYKGGLMLREYDRFEELRSAMHDALIQLKESFPHHRSVSSLEIIIALRTSTETVKSRLEALEAELEEVTLKGALLKTLKEKRVSV